jgi:hypothetical protein
MKVFPASNFTLSGRTVCVLSGRWDIPSVRPESVRATWDIQNLAPKDVPSWTVNGRQQRTL